MWRSVSKSEAVMLLQKAIVFTGDADLYGTYMQRVCREWPKSCEHNLTDRAMNRKAWIGHAATTLAINCPEQITRQAWRLLSEDQRVAANEQAANAIKSWEESHAV